MQPRFHPFRAAYKASLPWIKIIRPSKNVSMNTYGFRSCRCNFSTSPAFRSLGQSSKRALDSVERQYPARLSIYHAGELRTTWVSFWKGVALLQFGTTLVFGAPMLWNNENQPDAKIRKFQAVLVGVLGTIPTLTLAYVTAPFVHQVFLQIPEYARRSRSDLMHFVRTLTVNPKGTANTKLEFETLRIFPFRKTTAAYIHELRVLPPKRFRLSNIELPKTEAWAKHHRAKGIRQRIFELLKEPRFRFYVKEGRLYTAKTKVQGVWEAIAKRIQEQTLAEKEESQIAKSSVKRPVALRGPVRPVIVKEVHERVKRQTSRPPRS